MRVLICGFGSIGRRHLQNLWASGERDISLYRTFQSALPDTKLDTFQIFTDLEAALEAAPQAVIIANPTALHLDIAIPAAKAGCHILLEKPISHSMERIDELQKAVISGGGKVLVGYHYRFHPGLQRIHDLLKSDAIGRPISFRAHWGEYLPGWHPWEDYSQSYSARADLGGGVILTLSHPFDYIHWLLGEISEVWAFAGKLSHLDVQVEDTAEIGLRLDNGIFGSVHLDYAQQPGKHQLEIIGTSGTIHWDNATGITSQFLEISGRWESFPLSPDFERNDLYISEMRHFLSICREEVQPVCALEDGIHALKVALAALESQSSGCKVVLDG